MVHKAPEGEFMASLDYQPGQQLPGTVYKVLRLIGVGGRPIRQSGVGIAVQCRERSGPDGVGRNRNPKLIHCYRGLFDGEHQAVVLRSLDGPPAVFRTTAHLRARAACL